MSTACAVCGRTVEKKLLAGIRKNGREFDVLMCGDCMIGVTSPMPGPEELASLYSSGEYRATDGIRFRTLVEWVIYLFRLKRRQTIQRHVKTGRILDIGCGRGLFLDVMKREGWDVVGVEVTNEAAAAASQYGLHVISGGPDDWDFADGSFDVITMNHVLEHIARPADYIRKCGRLLRNGGILFVAVPNISSLQARAGKGDWFHLDLPYHLHHFSAEGLCKLLRDNAFRVREVRHFNCEYNPFGWLQTLLNLTFRDTHVLYDLLKSPTVFRGKVADEKRRFIMAIGVLPFYLLLALVLSLVESLAGRGGTVDVLAVKE